MRLKFQISNFKFQIFLLLVTCYLLLVTSVHAQSCITITPRADGLISTPQESAGTKFGASATGACIIDPKAAFVPFKIPSFDDLKSLYYDQSKVTKNTALTSISTSTSFTGDTLYYVSSDLTISGTPTGSGTQIIFVNGNLNITSDYTYGTATTGTVFIVKGNVNISYTPTLVTRVDAIIISQGTICTAYDGVSCPGVNVTTSQLVINGSLVSLTDTAPIKFQRALTDNNQPAEKINHQIKYLVLLKDLLSSTYQKWSEISEVPYVPSPAPTPTLPTPTPTPTLAPTPTPGVDSDADGDPDSSDCGPNDNRAKHGQTQFFVTTYTNKNSQQSFDFDCNGVEAKQYDCLTSLGAAACYTSRPLTGTSGYTSTIPSCGTSAAWKECWSWNNSSCNDSVLNLGLSCSDQCPTTGNSWKIVSTTKQQACH